MLTVQQKELLSQTNSQNSPAALADPAKPDFTNLYWESTQELFVGLYGKRDPSSGLPIESVNDIIYRVATSTALAELKYALTPQELIDLRFADALKHPAVIQWTHTFADNIGNQR